MRRMVLYIIVLLALMAFPAERTNVGRLLPVEAVRVSQSVGHVEIETDTGNIGVGENLEEAYLDLKERASGEIFLDTADYLILSGAEDRILGELNRYIKERIRVCRAEGSLDLEAAAQYLAVHRLQYRLKDIISVAETELLTQMESGFCLS